jgi:hypothetical protein
VSDHILGSLGHLIYPLYSYAYLGIHPHLLTISRLLVMMLSHKLATRTPPPLLRHQSYRSNSSTSTLLYCSSLIIPSITRTLWTITWISIGIFLANQFNGNIDPESPWMLRNFLSSLSSSPAVKMPLKAPPKPTVPAAIKSAENATPAEGGEYFTWHR